MENKNDPHARKSTVQQHPAQEHNINTIMARHLKSPNRMLPPGNPAATLQPRFEAMPSMTYHEMLNKVTDIRMRFAQLSASIRRKFRNDPYQLFRFMEDPQNRMECVRLGIVHPTEDEYHAVLVEQEAARNLALAKAQEALGQINAFPRPAPLPAEETGFLRPQSKGGPKEPPAS